MELREAVSILLANVLNQLSYHPLFAPYLKTSTEDPPQHYLHQCEIIVRLALRKPIRVLIGDEIGLGKTVTALAVAKYLESTGRVKRTLIVVPRVLVLQWHKELVRMGIPTSKIKHLESENIEFYRTRGFPEGYYIASMDLLKREERISKIVESEWDLIIVDEVHKFGYRTKRFWRIGKMLIEGYPSRNVIFLSATPHRGDPKDYIYRLRLLDPHLVEDWRKLDKRLFYEVTHGSILFRRTKEDVNNIYEEKKVFTDAKFYACLMAGRDDENKFVKELVSFLRTKLTEFAREKDLISEKVIPLLIILIFKRATSSPYSAWTTLQRLLLKRVEQDFPKELVASVESFLSVGYEDFEYEEDPEKIFNDFLDRASSLLSASDMEKIKELRDMAQFIMEKGDTKLNAITSLLESVIAETDSKVIVFTEYKDTLDYIVNNLKKKHPEWSQSILSLSSEEVRDEKTFSKVRDAFEKNPKARILVATDVIAEGVNLQVANIVVNYEIPWSLIKLEQRIGRVWRLGQKKDVEAYTFFMDNIADRAALNSMYQKLFNLKKAELQPRPITGQEVLFYYAEAKDIRELPPSVALARGRKKFVKVTEAKSIKTYLEKDEAGLQELVRQIVVAKQEIEKEISSKGVLYKPRSRREVEEAIKLTGFENHKEIFNSLKKLLKASAPIIGLSVVEEGENVKVWKGLEMPTYVNTLDGFYANLAGRSSTSEAVCLVARGDSEALITLIPVSIRDRRDGTLLYADLIGVDLTSRKIFTGSSLLNIVSQAIANCVGTEKLDDRVREREIDILIRADVIDKIRDLAEILDVTYIYKSRLENCGLRVSEKTWIRNSDIDIVTSDAVGCLHFVKLISKPPEDVPEDIKREVEKKAIEKVLADERAEGRLPFLMPEREHYDIRSVNPSTGEVRLIEVKGHKGLEIYAELTEDEARVASREKERYWLYIVYDIESGQPKTLKIQNPLENMDLQVFERIQKRYILRPKT
ncbi:MAG: helicase-related protein [Sulfolobales archaeon]|nr:helicase-related protein [Sulfolobales archaeon]MDW8082490.1 helicase-related protein [Sulfolobales archaeon]